LGRRGCPLRRLLAYTHRARRPTRCRSRAPSRSLATRDAACEDTLTSQHSSLTARASNETQNFHPLAPYRTYARLTDLLRDALCSRTIRHHRRPRVMSARRPLLLVARTNYIACQVSARLASWEVWRGGLRSDFQRATRRPSDRPRSGPSRALGLRPSERSRLAGSLTRLTSARSISVTAQAPKV